MLYALSGISLSGLSAAKNKIPVNIDSYDYRAICLFVACIVYGLFGSPTPDSLGIVEICVGVLLALSIGIGHASDAFILPAKRRFWKSAAQIFLGYGLFVPLIAGVIAGHSIAQILRDILPFLFLFLPLFSLPIIRERPHYFRTTLLALILIGLLFSLRSLVMRFDIECAFPVWCESDALLYLENMPTVLFSCLLLFGSAISYIARGISVRNVVIFSLLVMLALLPLSAMILTLQRASVGALVLYLCLIYAYFIYKAPMRGLMALVIGVIAIAIVNISFAAVFDSLWDKTQNVGLNMRPQEMRAVWQVVTADPFTFMFGLGWGGYFNSPAVGGLSVNFTHNFFSSMLLKAGVIGLVLCIAYIAGLLERSMRVIIKNPVFGLALIMPIFIDLTLYASFKSLDFGLVLLMISGSLVYFRQSESLQV